MVENFWGILLLKVVNNAVGNKKWILLIQVLRSYSYTFFRFLPTCIVFLLMK